MWHYRVHQAIVASGSKYFLEVFRKYRALGKEESKDAKAEAPKPGELPSVEIPKPMKTACNPNSNCSDEIVNRILKFIYNNQDFSVIKKEITETNVMGLYSQAFMMKCTFLLNFLDEMIVEELLSPENCSAFYLDAIRVSQNKVFYANSLIQFKSKVITDACEILIRQNFKSILQSEKGLEFIMSLPFQYIKNICESNQLTIDNENDLVRLLEKYLNHRKDLPLLDEEKPKIDEEFLK